MPPKRTAPAAPDGATAPKRVKTDAAPKKATGVKKAAENKTTEKAEPKKAAPKKAAPKKAAADKAETKAAPKKEAATKKTTTAKKPAAEKAAPKKAPAAKKAAAPKKGAKRAEESDKENQAAKVNGVKRTRDESEEQEEQNEEVAVPDGAEADNNEAAAEPESAAKKRKAAPAKPKKEPAPKKPRVLKAINEPPTQVLDVFVFGEGTAGELGLGSVRVDGKKPIDVKRPRLNHNLKGVVQIACGGMHVAALTKDNKILTWGVNDQGALGRDTTWEGGLRDMDDEDSDSDSDDDDTGMNPKESTPAEIDTKDIPEGTTWVQVVASDSATFALTTTGQVYGWGTFRVSLLFLPHFLKLDAKSPRA